MTGTDTHIEGIDPGTGEVLRLQIEQGRIAAITRSVTAADDALPLLAPGLVDMQVNGFAGTDVNAEDTDADAIAAITDALARRGITTWVPTVVTADETHICHALHAVRDARAADPATAAAVPFAHVEGPFLSPVDGPRGVHAREHLRPIDPREVARWQAAGPLGYVTVSPHEEAAPAAIAEIVASGITVAIGHTHASPAQIRAAVDAGATLSTHLGNGIAPHLPRHPNAIWEQLADQRLVCGLIGDGHHLPAATLVSMIRALGPQRAFLVSDAVELAGSAPGRYRTAVGGEVELSTDGRLSYVGTELLAGAAADLAHGLRFAIRSGIGLVDALALVTRTPGHLVHRLAAGRIEEPYPVTGHVGDLRVGARADVVELDRAGVVHGVLRAGRRIV